MVQFDHVNDTDGNFTVKLLAGTSVIQVNLTRRRQTGHRQHAVDVVAGGTVKYRCCHRNAAFQVGNHFQLFGFA